MGKLVIEVDSDHFESLANGLKCALETGLSFLHALGAHEGDEDFDLRIDHSDEVLRQHPAFIAEKNACLLVEGSDEPGPIRVRIALVPGQYDTSNWGMTYHGEHVQQREYSYDEEGNPRPAE